MTLVLNLGGLGAPSTSLRACFARESLSDRLTPDYSLLTVLQPQDVVGSDRAVKTFEC